MKYFLILMALVTLNISSIAQNDTTKFTDGFLRKFNFSRPFVAEVHSTINKIEVGYHRDFGPYNLSDKFAMYKRPMVEIHLGFDIPLYSFDIGNLNNNTPKWSFGLSLPVSIHVLEDMWEPITAAVIDVDYRFGSPRLSAITFFEDVGFYKNLSFSWLPIFHECTHLGDELVLAIDAKDYPLRRVNVSYEYTEFQITLNDPNGTMKTNHAFRIGARYRISDRGYGWFGVESFAVDTTIVEFEHSTHRFEWSVEYQLQRSHGFLAGKRIMNIFSLDVSSRVKFGIPVYQKVNDEWVAKDKQEN
ncbi:MAG: hypothetical protein QM503_00590, partial [Bacteroidota bacterium]